MKIKTQNLAGKALDWAVQKVLFARQDYTKPWILERHAAGDPGNPSSRAQDRTNTRHCINTTTVEYLADEALQPPYSVEKCQALAAKIKAYFNGSGGISDAEVSAAADMLEWAAVDMGIPTSTSATMSDEQIKAVFLANGFTIKPGCDDLKPYVYAAARALLAISDAEVGKSTTRTSEPVNPIIQMIRDQAAEKAVLVAKGVCPTCEGKGECGGQFTGGEWVCEDCNGSGRTK